MTAGRGPPVPKGAKAPTGPGFQATVWDLAEFFVMRKYRRRGVGSLAARQLFETHRGKWEIRQRLANTPATAFWRRVVGEFSGGKFEETFLDDDRWHGPMQSFES